MSGAVKAVSKVVSAVIKPVSSLLGGLLGVKQPKMADSNSEPSSQTLRSSKAPARYCLGRFSTGGVLAWGQEQAGSQADNEWLHLVYVLSEGAIEGVDEIWLGEQLIGSYGLRATYELVTDPSEVNAFLLANSPGWRESQIGRGLSFLRLSLKYSSEVFPSGIPDVRIVGRGRKDMHDPRTGNTSYSENAALVILWYLRTVLGVPDDEIIMPSFASAANVCAESVASPGGGASARYTIGAVVGDDEAPAGVLEKMCRACDGRLIRIGGRWTLQVGAYYGPYDFTITEDMLAGAVQGRTEVDNDKAINTIHGTFIDPSQSWTETDYPPVQVAEWLMEDGAELADDLPLGYVNNPYQGQRLASIELRRRRNGGELTLPMNMFGYNCRPGRVARVVLPSLNIDGEFIVTDWNMGADGACNVSVSAYGPEIFDDAVGQPYNPLGFIQLPAGGMAPPTGLTFTPDDTAEVFQGVLRWVQPYAAVEYFGVIIRDVEGVAIQTYQVPGAAAQCQVAGLPAGAYTMAVFARGPLARSAEATVSVSIMGPPAPLSVSTQESFDSITIIPFNPGGLNGGTYEYFYSLTQVANPENAIYLGEGGAFTHNGLSYNTVYHYYVRSRNAYGVSQFYYLTAKTVAEPGLILEIIEGQITESQLGQHLKEEIGKISGVGPGSVNERIGDLRGELDASVDGLNAAIGAAEDRLSADIGAVSVEVGILDQSVAALQSDVSGLGSDLQTSVAGLNDAIEDVDSRLTGRIENVASDIAGLGTSISDLYGQVAGLDDDLHGSVSSLNSQLAQLETQIADITGAEDWATDQAYLAGTLVRFDGSLYRAEQDVPAGTPVTNELYWRKVGDYSSLGEAVASLAIQVSDIQSRVADIDGTLTAQVQKTDTLIAAVRPNRADGEKADSLRGWQTQASITQRDRVEASDKAVLAERLLVIDAQIVDTSAQLSTLEQAFASETEATAGQLTQLAAELGTTAAGLQQEIRTRATETAALASDVQSIQAALGDVASAAAFNALVVEVTQLGDDISSVSQSVTSLTSRIEETETGLGAVSTAVDGLQTSVSQIEGELSAQASDITALGVSIGEVGDLAGQADGKADEALQGLGDKADATAVQGLTVEVQQLGEDVSANSGLITELEGSVQTAQGTADDALAAVATKADASAVQALTIEVGQIGDTATANSGSITQLESSVVTAQQAADAAQDTADEALQELASKADSSALQSLTTEVEQVGADVAANSGAITALGTRVESAETGIAGNADAVESLTTEVSEIDGRVAAAAEQASRLSAELRPERADGSKADSLRGWMSQASIVESSRVSASEREVLAQRLFSAEVQLGEASAQLSVLETAFADESESTASQLTALASELGTTASGLQQEIQTRATETAALASDVQSMQVALEGVATSEALQVLTVEVEQLGSDITSVAQSVTDLSGRIESTETGLQGLSDAVSGLQTSVSDIEGELTAQATDITALGVSIGAASDLAEQADGKADSALEGLADKADASAVQALTTEVNQIGEDLSAASQSITDLGSSLSLVSDVADAAASLAEDADGKADEALQGLTTKADASAVQALTTEVEQIGEDVAANSGAITQLGSRLESAETGIAGNADAVESLTTEVELIDGKVEAAAEQASRLSAQLRPDRADGEKADSLRGWQSQASITESSRVSASEREALAQRLFAAEVQMGEANAQLSILEQAFADEAGATASQLTSLASEIGSTSSALSNEISTRTSETAALAQDVQALQAALGDAASADALAALITEVEDLEGRVSATAQDIVSLSASLAQAIDDIATKADSTALQALEATVTQQGDQITATAQSVTDLQATVDDEISAAVQSLQQAVADESAARASDISTVTATASAAQQAADDAQDDADLALQGVADNAAAVQQANQAIADEASARASAIQTVQASVGTVADQAQDAADAAGQASQDASAASAAVQVVSQAVTDINNQTSAMWAVRMEVRQDGQYVWAGTGLSIEPGPNGWQSQFLIEANRFALLNTIDGQTTVPFVVENGQTIINSAVIKQADIINLIVTGVLQSPDYVPGMSGMRMNFVTSEFEVNGGVPGEGRTNTTNRGTRVYDENDTLRVQIGDLRP